MKTPIPILLKSGAMALGCALTLLAASSQAANVWWDNNGSSVPNSGTWNTNTASWSLTTNLTASPVVFTNGNFPEFAAGTNGISSITISVPGPVLCAGLAIGLNVGTAAQVTNLTFTGAGPIIITNGLQGFFCGPSGSFIIYIDTPLAGTGGLEQHSSGSLALEATNTYTGGTELTGGQVIYYYNNGSFGTGAITVDGYGNALLNNTLPEVAITIPNSFSFPVVGEAINLAGGNPVGGAPGTTYSGAFPLPASGMTILETSSTATEWTAISGAISGSSGLEVSDAGVLALAGTNTYTGGTYVVSPAPLIITNNGTLGGGNYAGPITNNSTLIYASSRQQTNTGVQYGIGKTILYGPAPVTYTATSPSITNTFSLLGGSKLVDIVGGGMTNSTVAVGNGATNSVVVATAGKLWSYGSLICSNGSTLDFNFGYTVAPSTTVAPLYINGAANFVGTPTVTVEAGNFPGVGTYPLITWASTSGTPPTSVVLPPHVVGSLVVSGNTLNLVVTADTEPVRWTGAAGNGLWDIGVSQNWDDAAGNPTYYLQPYAPGDAVVLDETYITNDVAVTLNTVVAPDGVTVSNTIYSYSIAGSGSITGPVGLTLIGGGTVLLGTTNSFTGQVKDLGGTLIVGADTDLGAAPSSATPTALVLSNATLSVTNSISLSANRGITLQTNANLDVPAAKQLNYAGVIAGTGTLAKTSPGTVVLGGNTNSYTGSTIIVAGMLEASADHYTGGVPSNLGVTPANYTPTNIILAGGVLGCNNTNFILNPNRGIYVATNSGLTSLNNDVLGIPGPINGPGNLTISNVGSGLVYFTATNVYTGNTLLAAGLLALEINGSIASSSLSIAAGAGLDVSKLTTNTYAFGGSSFTASGAGTATNVSAGNAAYINGASGGFINLESLPIYLNYTPASTSGEATNPALYITQGALELAGNSITVTNAAASPLGAGVYVLIAQNGGSIVATPAPTVAVVGAGIVAGDTASIVVSNNAVDLVVATPAEPPVIATAVTNTVPAGYLWQESILTLSNTAGWSDPQGDTLTLTSVGPLSADGTNVTTDGANIYYGGPVTVPDSFSYVISDGTLTATGMVYLATVTAPPITLVTPALNASGNPTFSGTASPDYTYGVESTTNLAGPWFEAGDTATGANGAWSFTDLSQTNPAAIFYRLYYPDDPSSPPQ